MKMMSSKAGRATVVILCVTQVAGCQIGYYWQATTGHLKIMRERRPVAEVIADSATPHEVRERLEISGAIVSGRVRRWQSNLQATLDSGDTNTWVVSIDSSGGSLDNSATLAGWFATPQPPLDWCITRKRVNRDAS
jgi:predicted aminopeptidase